MNDETSAPGSVSGLLTWPVIWRVVVVIVLLILILWVGPRFFSKRAVMLSSDWLDELEGKAVAAEARTLDWSESLADVEARVRLEEQYQEVLRWIAFHREVMTFFYVRYYVAIAMSALLGFLAALAAALISRKGWADTDPTLVVAFLVLAAGAAFCAGYPAIYQQKSNIEANKANYLKYRDLDRRIRTFAISGKTPAELIAFLPRVDQEIERLQALPIGLEDAALAAQRQAIEGALAETDDDGG